MAQRHTDTENSDGAIDFDHLSRQTMGDDDLAAEVLGLFFDQAFGLIDLLKSSKEDRVWYETSHAIKGAARGVGLLRLGDMAEKAEQMMGSSAVSNRASILTQMKAELEEGKVSFEAKFQLL